MTRERDDAAIYCDRRNKYTSFFTRKTCMEDYSSGMKDNPVWDSATLQTKYKMLNLLINRVLPIESSLNLISYMVYGSYLNEPFTTKLSEEYQGMEGLNKLIEGIHENVKILLDQEPKLSTIRGVYYSYRNFDRFIERRTIIKLNMVKRNEINGAFDELHDIFEKFKKYFENMDFKQSIQYSKVVEDSQDEIYKTLEDLEDQSLYNSQETGNAVESEEDYTRDLPSAPTYEILPWAPTHEIKIVRSENYYSAFNRNTPNVKPTDYQTNIAICINYIIKKAKETHLSTRTMIALKANIRYDSLGNFRVFKEVIKQINANRVSKGMNNMYYYDSSIVFDIIKELIRYFSIKTKITIASLNNLLSLPLAGFYNNFFGDPPGTQTGGKTRRRSRRRRTRRH